MTSESDREHPNALGKSDREMFARFGIGVDLLADAGVRRVTDAEAFHRYGLRSDADKTGIVFPYFNPINGDRWTARLRRDNPQVDSEGKPEDKYLCPWGDNRHLYIPPGGGMLLSDVSVPVVFVEAEKSVLAIAALGTRCGRRVLAVGTGGCWGWRGKTGITSGPNGEREETRGPLPDFGLLTLKGRNVLIALDSNVASNPQVWQARQALVETLTSRGAKVGLVDLPAAEGVNGPDDFIAVYGDGAMLSLLDSARPPAQTGAARGPSQATRLLRLSNDVELFHTSEGRPYGTIAVGVHHETWPVRSTHFRQWLSRRFYESEKGAPNAQALQDALGVISAKAQFDGDELPVFLRVAQSEGSVYLDLGNPAWQAVEVTPSGWSIVSRPPVRFRRSNGMMALPTPKRGGRIASLRRFVNVKDDDWILYVSWLVACFRPKGPYPILGLHGEQGSAKTTSGRVARQLIDPFKAPMRTKPRDERDLMITASNSHIITLDNLSYLDPWLSDALCRLATGGGLATRELYKDEEEIIFDAQRPILLNGIEEVAANGDLLDRMVILSLPGISDRERKEEEVFWAEFEVVRPLILGALLSGVSSALNNIHTVKLENKPRMADFATWVSAAEGELGFSPGKFMDAYAGNRREASDVALESSPVATEVCEFMRDKEEWEGATGELLKSLNAQVKEESQKGRAWPKSAKALSNSLTRLNPNLRDAGITIRRLPREAGTGRRLIRLEKDGVATSQPSRSRQPQADHEGACDDRCDDVGGRKTAF